MVNKANSAITATSSIAEAIQSRLRPLQESAPAAPSSHLVQKHESTSFLATALAWKGSVTPYVLPYVVITVLYSWLAVFSSHFFPSVRMTITPFEYSGTILALILVFRINAGYDRWWEARKLWGTIVNQSRNLAITVFAQFEGQKSDDDIRSSFLTWVGIFPYVIKENLRFAKNLDNISAALGKSEYERLLNSRHMPTFVALRLSQILQKMVRDGQLSPNAYLRAETERSILIDAVGACERIRNTPIPLALAIKSRRFILLFLLLLPFALAPRLGWNTMLVMCLVSYAMFSLDEIGMQLQSPFSVNHLSHLPLDQIAKAIECDVLEIHSVDEPFAATTFRAEPTATQHPSLA